MKICTQMRVQNKVGMFLIKKESTLTHIWHEYFFLKTIFLVPADRRILSNPSTYLIACLIKVRVIRNKKLQVEKRSNCFEQRRSLYESSLLISFLFIVHWISSDLSLFASKHLIYFHLSALDWRLSILFVYWKTWEPRWARSISFHKVMI